MKSKQDLINDIHSETDVSTKKIKIVIETALEIIMREVVTGNGIALKGFGSFTLSKRQERSGRNPITGEKIIIPAHNTPHFKASKFFKESVN